MKTLIAYYSFTQNNAQLARYLVSKLQGDIVRVEPVKKYTGFSIMMNLLFGTEPAIKPVPYDFPDYDHIVFVAPVWAGRVAMPLRKLLREQRANIRNYSFLTLCGGGNVAQKEKISKALQQVTGKMPAKVVELWMTHLKSSGGGSGQGTARLIQPDALQQFDAQIREFLEALTVESDVVTASAGM